MLPDDKNDVYLFRDNLAKVCINECFNVLALIDTGACCSAISLQTVHKLRQAGQRCIVYSTKNLNITAANGSKLEVIGKVHLRIKMGSSIITAHPYVIANLSHYFIIGTDMMRKYRMTIDYDNEQLFIKRNIALATVNPVCIKPNSEIKFSLSCATELYPGIVGKVCAKPVLFKFGLNCIQAVEKVSENSRFVPIIIKNNTNRTIRLRKNFTIANFKPFDNTEYDACGLPLSNGNSHTEFTNAVSHTAASAINTNVHIASDHAREREPVTHDSQPSSDYNVPDVAQSGYVLPKSIERVLEKTDDTSFCNIDPKQMQFNVNDCNLSQDEKRQMLKFLNQNRDVFAQSIFELGRAKDYAHKITLKPDAKPFKTKPYRCSPKQKEIINQQLDEWLKAGIIQPSESDYSSAIVLVPKKSDPDTLRDGLNKDNWRCCIDLRNLNKQVYMQNQNLPIISDLIDSIGPGKAKYQTTLDAMSGFLQIPLAQESRKYTAFSTNDGAMYEFCVLPFGLVNSSTAFSANMYSILGDLIREGHVCCYIDDVYVHTESFSQHLEILNQVFIRFRNAGLKFKLSKSNFARTHVKWLGFILSADGVSVDPDKVKIVVNYKTPRNATEIRQFLGLTGYYRRAIPSYAAIAKHLTQLTRKNATFIWGPEQQAAFVTLKQKLINAPVMGLPDYNAPYILRVDASHQSLSAILSQEQQGVERVIYYAARNLRANEMNWHSYELEAAAVAFAFTKFNSFLQFNFTTVYTDCAPLLQIFQDKQQHHSLRIRKFIYFLSQYNYVMKHERGCQNTGADSLSRIEHEEDDSPAIDELPREPFFDSITCRDRSAKLVKVTREADYIHTTHNRSSNQQVDNFITLARAPDEPAQANLYRNSLSLPTHNQLITSFDHNLPSWRPYSDHPLPISQTHMASADSYIISMSHATPDANAQDSSIFDAEGTKVLQNDTLNLEILIHEQHLDYNLLPLINYIRDNVLPDNDKEARKIIMQSENYSYIDSILYHHHNNKRKNNMDESRLQIVIPSNLRWFLLNSVHDKIMHRGIDGCFNTLTTKYFWATMYADVTQYVRSCEVCCKYTKPRKADRAPLQSVPTAQKAFCTYVIDIIGKLPKTAKGYEYILLVVDSFTKACELIPLKSIDAHTIAIAIFENIICRYGTPNSILSDKGSQFISAVMEHLCRLTGTKHLSATAYNHQTVGQAERVIRDIK